MQNWEIEDRNLGLVDKDTYRKNVGQRLPTITKDDFNQAVIEFGDNWIGGENKQKIRYKANQIAADLDYKKTKIKNNVDPWVLAIGDKYIGDDNKQKLKYKVKEIAHKLKDEVVPNLKHKMKHMKDNSIYTKVNKKSNTFMAQLGAKAKEAFHWLMSDPPASTLEEEADGRHDYKTAAVGFIYLLGISIVQLYAMGIGAITNNLALPTIPTSLDVPQPNLGING